jgi:HK97 family phage major capsid protein
MAKLDDLQNKRQELAAKIHELAPKADKWTAEDEAAWKAVNADYDAVKAELDTEIAAAQAADKKLADAAARLADVDAYQAYQPANRPRFGRDGGRMDNRSGNSAARMSMALQGWLLANAGVRDRITDEHRAAAAAMNRSVDDSEFVISLSTSDHFNQCRNRWVAPQNAMTIGNPDTGGATVGSTLVNSLEKAMLDYSGVLQVAEVLRTDNGEPLAWPTIDDTANTGSRVGEGADAGTASDPVMGRTTWSAFDFTSGLLNVSRNLLTDSIFNLEQVIGEMMGERLGRKQNTDYTTGGGGGNSPAGIVTRSTLGKTAASATAIVWDELIDLEHSVDPSRRSQQGVGYMLNDAILQAVRKLKDGNGQPIWQSGWNAGMPDLLNNRRYWINQAMASSIASGAKTVLFGQLSQYKVRQVGTITLQRLRERRAEFNQDVFIAYMRGDGNLLDAGDHPVKHLVH